MGGPPGCAGARWLRRACDGVPGGGGVGQALGLHGAVGQALRFHSACAMASLLWSSAVSSRFFVVSQEEW